MNPVIRLLAATALTGLTQSALTESARAQQTAAQDDAEPMEILVTGTRLPGAVLGDIKPEITFSPADVRSLGVSSVSELVSELAAQTGSGQGRGGEAPIVLLNGGRISGFSEVRDIPSEAIARVEILPEEVALKYGYRATQKVMNIVLRRRFRAVTVELEGTQPTEGGQWAGEAGSTLFRTGTNGRLNMALDYERASALTEAERGIIQQASAWPYAVGGNISAISAGAEIDPALSLLKGGLTSIAGVPGSALTRVPTLADFAVGAVNSTDMGAYRTLQAETETVKANAVFARPLSGGTSLSVNAGLTYNESAGMRGLGTASLILPAASPWSPFAGDTRLNLSLAEFGALEDRSRDWSGHVGAMLNGMVGGWTWNLTGNLDHAQSRSRNETGYDLSAAQTALAALDPLFNPYAPLSSALAGDVRTNSARSRATSGDATLVLSGTAFSMPAGKAALTLTLGGKAIGLDSRSIRNGVDSAANLSRTEGNSQISLDLPIASRKEGVLSALGELSVNLNAGYDQLSDAGGQRLIGAGLNWTPIKPLSFILSWNRDEGAPTIQQLGNPQSLNSGVRVYDYVRGETVDITRTTGGNPLLGADDRRVIKLGMTLKPFSKTDLSFTANYTDSRITDPIAGFPAATAAIQAAFPSRFTRDASGRLTAIDARPVNFDQSDQKELRWGFNFSKQLAAPKPPPGGWRPPGMPRREGEGSAPSMQDAMRVLGAGAPGGSPPHGAGGPGTGAGAGPGGGPPRGFGGGGMRGTRMNLSVYHTLRIADRILIAPGGPELDLLNGDATGGTGGVSRHEVRVQGGVMHNGMGLRLNATWRSGSTVDSGAETLHFSDLATINLRLFANLGLQRALVEKVPFLRGTRISIGVNNLFNSRQRVRDGSGVTPLGFQPAYLDPLGRTVSLSFRKLMF